MYGYGMGWGWFVLMPLVWIALAGLIIWAVIRLVQPGSRDSRPPAETETTPRPETPQEILDRRLASGEIDAETYRQTRDTLAGRS